MERKERKSWVVWEENGKVPDVIIEVTSASTVREDHIRKKQVYASIGIPEYFIYDPFTHELTAWRLILSPRHYVPIPPGPDRRFPCASLGLSLGLHETAHRGFAGPWLRWFVGGQVLPTPDEKAIEAGEQLQAKDEQLQAKDEQLRQSREREQQAGSEAERLRQLLLKAGIDPDRG